MHIDGAVHVWSEEDGPYPGPAGIGQERPTQRASAEALLETLDQAGFGGAVCIQPRAYGYNHRYLTKVVAASPDRFAAVCLVDPISPDGPAALRTLVQDLGFSGVRLLPYADDDPSWLDGPHGDPLWEEARRLSVPVSILPRPDQLSAILARARRHPDITVVIDHLGLVRPEDGAVAIDTLLKCAEAPNTIVKVSAFIGRSASPWPHADLYPLIQGAVDAFGPARSVFGTDWPHVISYGPYEKSLNLLDMCLDLDDGDRELVLGGTATRVWFSRPTNK